MGHASLVTTWTSATWATPAFEAELRAFVGGSLGEPDRIALHRIRPWSAVWRVEQGRRVAYAKQNCPGQAHEAVVMSALAGIAPDLVVPVLAADPARDLLVTEELGAPLGDTAEAGDVDAWARTLAAAADLQRRTVGHVAELGLTVLPPEDSTEYVADAVGRLAALPADDPRRLAPETAARLQALLPTIGRWSEDVEDAGLPLALVHNDLHTHNVVGVGDRLRFFDFADAVVGEPLGNLLVPLRVLGRELDAGPDDPRLWRVADAALEVWSDLVPIVALRRALPSALQLARLARVESWRRCVATMTPSERAEFGSAPADWLGTLTEQPPLGAAVAH